MKAVIYATMRPREKISLEIRLCCHTTLLSWISMHRSAGPSWVSI